MRTNPELRALRFGLWTTAFAAIAVAACGGTDSGAPGATGATGVAGSPVGGGGKGGAAGGAQAGTTGGGQGGSSGVMTGDETGPCYPNKTCNGTLSCLSGLCVDAGAAGGKAGGAGTSAGASGGAGTSAGTGGGAGTNAGTGGGAGTNAGTGGKGGGAGTSIGTGGTSSGGDDCASVCAAQDAAQCPADMPGVCIVGCTKAQGTAASMGCKNEFSALVACVGGGSFSCDPVTMKSTSSAPCDAVVSALVTCESGGAGGMGAGAGGSGGGGPDTTIVGAFAPGACHECLATMTGNLMLMTGMIDCGTVAAACGVTDQKCGTEIACIDAYQTLNPTAKLDCAVDKCLSTGVEANDFFNCAADRCGTQCGLTIGFTTTGCPLPSQPFRLHLRKWTKIALGAATLWPILYVFAFVAVIVGMMLSAKHGGLRSPAGGGPPAAFIALAICHVGTMLMTFALMAFYIVYLFKTPRLPQEKKTLWAIVLFMGGPIAMSVFFYLHIWPDDEASPRGQLGTSA